MSHSSLPLNSKLFQLTSLSCALALTGCGGSDGTDVLAPKPDLGVKPGDNNTGGGTGGGTQTPAEDVDFHLQKLYTTPANIELSDEPVVFSVTVKAAAKKTGSAVINKKVSLTVEDSENNGVTIEGLSDQNTDDKGEATYELKLNPNVLSNEQKANLLTNGFKLKAMAKRQNGAVVEQVHTVSVRKKGSGDGAQVIDSKLSIKTSLATASVSNNKLNPYGDTAVLTIQTKAPNGALAAGVTVGASILDVKGVSIDKSSQVTDEQGMARFTIKITDDLTQAQRENLIRSGLLYSINIQEKSGATKSFEDILPVALPISDYNIEIDGNLQPLNAYGDMRDFTVFAKPINSKVPTKINGAKATVKINNNIKGVSFSSENLTLNAEGKAVVSLAIAKDLDSVTRNTLKTQGISYTVTLAEPNQSITSKTYNQKVYIPEPQSTIGFVGSDKVQLTQLGDSAIIKFKITDKNGGAVAKQKVTASLPKNLIDNGLTLTTASVQETNENGEVSYTVSVPEKLSNNHKVNLNKIGSFVLTASTIDALGISSEIQSTAVKIKLAEAQSNISLTSSSVPNIVNSTDSSFQIKVLAKRPDSSAASGKSVKLSIQPLAGVTLQGNQKTTDATGVAIFTVNISQELSANQRDALIASGITYSAVLTDDDGSQSRIDNQNIKVVNPVSSIKFAEILSPSISQLGGDGFIRVKLLNKLNQPVEEQAVTIKLGKVASDYGVVINQNEAITDFKGETTFKVTIPEGLTYEQRVKLQQGGIDYQLSYVEKNITYRSSTQQVAISTPAVDLTIVNPPNFINNRPFYVLNGEGDEALVQTKLSTQNTNIAIAGQPIKFEFVDKNLAKLLNVNGKLGSAVHIINTNKDGVIQFSIIVPNNLTAAEKAALKNQRLAATLTETLTGRTQEVQFNIQSTKSAIDLIAVTPKSLNLNGGETQIEVIAKDSKDNVISGQKVFLALPAAIASQGVSLVSSGSQITDESGRAIFTLAVPATLTDEQKRAIGKSFVVALSAADANGNVVARTSRVSTVSPAGNGTQESISVGANKVVSTKGDTFKVFVRVKDKNGAIADRDVRLNVDDPIKTGVTVTSNTAKTNGDGVATFDLKLEAGANVNQALLEKGIKLTARTTTAENVELTQDYIVAVDTTTIDNYQILVASDKPTLNTGGDQTNATFRVTDGKGGVLQGVPVQLTINNLATSGAALTTPSMVTTDSEGKIDVGVLLTANSINARLNHEVKIDAKIITPVYDANGEVTLTPREEKSLTLSAIGTKIDLNAATSRLKDGETTTISTLLVDGSGLAIANAMMELVDENGDLIASDASGFTDADGKAVITIRENQLNFDSNGNLRVYARAVGENRATLQRSTASINLIKDSRAGISFTNIQEIYEVNQPQTVNIQIRTDSPQQAAALIGKKVNVQTSLGRFSNNNVIIEPVIAANNINGNNIDIAVQLSSNLAGIAVLQATVLGENLQNGAPRYQVSADTRFKAVTPAKMLFQAVKTVITPGGSTEVVAIVKDRNDVPVEGQTVVFSRGADSSAGRLSAATAITDSKGEARVVYQANASSPINGVVINARLLEDSFGIGTKTTRITVSEEAVYTTLAFANKLSSDNIYYTVQGSISVMDGSGRAVANQEVSIKSYAIEYAQGRVCALDSTIAYQPKDVIELDEKGNVASVTTPEPKVKSEIIPIFLKSKSWIPTEDPEFNYTLDKDADVIDKETNKVNGRLDPINPVAIIGGTVSKDGYSFVTDEEGRADFAIRYPVRYSSWVKVRFDSSTFVNGSENVQSINYVLPVSENDISISGTNLVTPWLENTSAFGSGGAICATNLNVTIREPQSINDSGNTKVILSPYEKDPNNPNDNRYNYSVSINGENPVTGKPGYNSFVFDFNKAFELGSSLSVVNNGFDFPVTLKVD